jgi:N-acetylneuraminic acid mutarotase
VAGKIYVIGGGDMTAHLGLPTVEAYDPTTDQWTTKADLPTPRHGLATSVVEGKIYTIGGFDGTNHATVEMYDPTTDTWTPKAELPTLRSHVCTGVVNGKIYAIGGWDSVSEDDGHKAFATVEVYDPATDRWMKKADMPTPRWSCASSVVNGKIYVIGGTTITGEGEWITTTKVEIYDPATDTWTPGGDMPTPRGWLSGSTVNGKFYAIGGASRFQPGISQAVVLSTVEEFVPSPLTNTHP